MNTLEIYKHALENLKNLRDRQAQLAQRHYADASFSEWRRKLMDTEAKIKWLEKLIELWEGV